jgi:predicted ATPase
MAGCEDERCVTSLPAVQHLPRAGELGLGSDATFLVGENGTGKPALIEAIAVCAGYTRKADPATSPSPRGKPSPTCTAA